MTSPLDPQSPLKVVLVSTRRDWGGGEQQAWLLLEGLRARGHDCFVLARHGGEFAQRLHDERFPVATFVGSGRNAWGLLQIRRHLGRIAPQVVHANDSHAMYASSFGSWGLSIPVRVASRRIAYRLRAPSAYRKSCDRVICVAKAVMQCCEESGLPRSMLRLAYSGNRPELIASGNRQRGRDALRLDEHAQLLLTVANLSENKGHSYLLDALPGVLARCPNVVLALAGQGTLREQLEQQARSLGVAEQVRFLGFRQDIPDLLHAADLFVMPSLKEGICGVLAEAMLAHCPVVATTSDGMREVLGCDEPGAPVGWPVPPGDAAALEAAILAALAAPGERAERTARGRVRALAHFTADRMVEANLAVYREVLAEKTTRSFPSAA